MSKKLFFISLILSSFMTISVSADKKSDDSNNITQFVNTADLEVSLKRLNVETLELLLNKEDKRKQYASNLSSQKRLAELVLKEKIEDTADFKQKLYREKQRLYLEALVEIETAKAKADFEELAKETYDSNPEMFKIARKIKIAQIYIDKSKAGYKEKVEKVKKALAESKNPATDFHKLAGRFTDGKYKKDQFYVGFYDKWLIQPADEKKLPAILTAAFKLKKVGDISDFVESEKSFQIVKLMADAPSRPQKFEAVKADIIKKEQSSLWANKNQKILNSLVLSDEELNFNDELLKKQLQLVLVRRKAEMAEEDTKSETKKSQ